MHNDIQTVSSLNQILWVLTPVLVGALGFFIVRSMDKTSKDVDSLYKFVEKHDNRISEAEGDIKAIASRCEERRKTKR